MAFTVSAYTQGDTAVINLAGDLDDTCAARFREKVKSVADVGGFSTLVLEMSQLGQMTAAGLRFLAYAEQRMPDDVRIVLVAPSAVVREAIDEVDFRTSVTIADVVPI
jgi:anti-anti-sigma factor